MGNDLSTWQTNIDAVSSFVNARPTIMRDNIKTGFSLAGKVTLTLNVSPAGAGRIENQYDYSYFLPMVRSVFRWKPGHHHRDSEPGLYLRSLAFKCYNYIEQS